MTKKIATKLDSRAVFLFLSSCHLASAPFGGDYRFDMESAPGAACGKQHSPQMNEEKSIELDQSPSMHETDRVRIFKKRIFEICAKYLDSKTEEDIKETWAVFFSLLEKSKFLKKNEIKEILKALNEEDLDKKDSIERLLSWYENYTENNPLMPNLSLSSREIKRRDYAEQLRHSF